MSPIFQILLGVLIISVCSVGVYFGGIMFNNGWQKYHGVDNKHSVGVQAKDSKLEMLRNRLFGHDIGVNLDKTEAKLCENVINKNNQMDKVKENLQNCNSKSTSDKGKIKISGCFIEGSEVGVNVEGIDAVLEDTTIISGNGDTDVQLVLSQISLRENKIMDMTDVEKASFYHFASEIYSKYGFYQKAIEYAYKNVCIETLLVKEGVITENGALAVFMKLEFWAERNGDKEKDENYFLLQVLEKAKREGNLDVERLVKARLNK